MANRPTIDEEKEHFLKFAKFLSNIYIDEETLQALYDYQVANGSGKEHASVATATDQIGPISKRDSQDIQMGPFNIPRGSEEAARNLHLTNSSASFEGKKLALSKAKIMGLSSSLDSKNNYQDSIMVQK